ncbi:hypothetical protein O9992_15345 [Vibrio lentus]|nr:hypothetical protein [Vibrio lentus]
MVVTNMLGAIITLYAAFTGIFVGFGWVTLRSSFTIGAQRVAGSSTRLVHTKPNQ